LHDSSFLLFYGHPHALWYPRTSESFFFSFHFFSFPFSLLLASHPNVPVVMVSDYVPRSPMLPTSFPPMIEKTLRYCAARVSCRAVRHVPCAVSVSVSFVSYVSFWRQP
jgi:hypothetical protein